MKRYILFLVIAAFVLSFGFAHFSFAIEGIPPGIAKKLGKDVASTPRIQPQVDLACMQAAVEKRDSAIIVALESRSAAQKLALQTRKDALKAAWALTVAKERRAAIKKVWNDYNQSIKNVRTDWKKAQKAAWEQFKKDRPLCGKHAVSEDQSPAGVDENL